MKNQVLNKGLLRFLVMFVLVSMLFSLTTAVVAEGTVSTLASGLNEPQGIALDGSGHLYFTDKEGIWRMDMNGANKVNLNESSVWFWGIAVTSSYIYYSDDATGTVERMELNGSNPTSLSNAFSDPGQIAIDALGRLWVADSGHNVIRRMDADGGNLTIIGSGFSYPYGVAVDGNYVYVADTGHSLVKRMTLTGTEITSIGGPFDYPFGVAVDGSGMVYVADSGNNAVYRMNSDGSGMVMLGAASDFQPKGLVTDSSGNVYVADTYNDAIKKITLTVTKLPQSPPVAPAIASSTATSVTLTTITGAEYRVGSGAWQSSPTFTGLSPNTSYTFYARLAETSTLLASPASSGTVYLTAKLPPPEAPSAPTVGSKTQTSITLTTVAGAQYRLGTGAWQDSPTFTGLSPDTEYSFYVRLAETTTTYASAASSALIVKTDPKTETPAPEPPTVGSKTQTNVTLTAVAGAQYRVGTGAWQNSPTFTGLIADTEYVFYVRLAETATALASPPSSGLTVKTDPKTATPAPAAPTVGSKTSSTVTLTAVAGAEYRLGSGLWQSSRVFSGLQPNTTYTFTIRIAETNIALASPPSGSITVTTFDLESVPVTGERENAGWLLILAGLFGLAITLRKRLAVQQES